jgi:hypothetical protein
VPDFKARIGREVPKEGETRVVFSILTARGTRMEIDGTYPEAVVLEAWAKFFKDASAAKGSGGHD